MDLFGILHAGERESSSSKRAHILENSVLVLEIQEVGQREHHSTVPATTSWFYAPDHHELLRVLVRQGAKDCGVQGAENGRVHTDAQGQCQHGDGSKSCQHVSTKNSQPPERTSSLVTSRLPRSSRTSRSASLRLTPCLIFSAASISK